MPRLVIYGVTLAVLLIGASNTLSQNVYRDDDKQPFGIYATGGGAILLAPDAFSSEYYPGFAGGGWAGLRFQNRIEALLSVEFMSFGYDGSVQNAEGGGFKPLVYAGYVKYYLGPPRKGSLRPFVIAGAGIISLAFNDIRRDGIAIQSREDKTKLLASLGAGGDLELSDRATLTLLGRLTFFGTDDDIGIMVPLVIGFRFAP